MPTLIVRQRRRPDRAWPLQAGEVLIGRGEGADLPLPNVAVSRRHARLVVGRSTVLHDLDTHNGTRVNGERVQEVTLQSGDRIQVGPFELIFLDDKTTVFGAKLVANYPRYFAAATARGDATFHLSKEELQAHLRGLKPLSERARLLHEDGRETLLGARSWWFGAGQDLEVRGSGRVAEIRWDVDHHVLVRHGWLARVLVNGRKVKNVALEPGDQVEVGDRRFKYDA